MKQKMLILSVLAKTLRQIRQTQTAEKINNSIKTFTLDDQLCRRFTLIFLTQTEWAARPPAQVQVQVQVRYCKHREGK